MYFHLMIKPVYGVADLAGFFPNLRREQLEKQVLEPYRQGRSITLSGSALAATHIARIRILQTGKELTDEQFKRGTKSMYPFQAYNDGHLKTFSLLLGEIGEDVTDELITGPPGHDREASPDSTQEHSPTADAREVFVVHGRNEAARRALFDFLRAIDLRPLEWAEAVQSTGAGAPYVGQVLDAAFSRAHAVVVLMTPDDEARLKPSLQAEGDPADEAKLTGQARPNVLFEAGMAMARSQDRTILVELGSLRPFSDIAGRHKIRIEDTTERRQDLAQRLESAGCPVRLKGADWQSAGDFATALKSVAISSESADDAEHEADGLTDSHNQPD